MKRRKKDVKPTGRNGCELVVHRGDGPFWSSRVATENRSAYIAQTNCGTVSHGQNGSEDRQVKP